MVYHHFTVTTPPLKSELTGNKFPSKKASCDNMSQIIVSAHCENFKRFHQSKLKKIKIKAKLPQVCEHFPLWSFSSIMKIIILILTTGNDSPILVNYVLVTFSDIEERKHQKLCTK